MATSRLVLASSNDRALEAAASWLGALPSDNAVIVVGATRDAADEFVRSLPAGRGLGLHRFSLVQLAAVFAREDLARSGLAPAGALAAQAVAARCVDRLLEEGRLSYFGAVARTHGFPAAVATTMGDLRMAATDAAAVRACNSSGADIADVLDAYTDELSRHRLADVAEFFETACQAASPLLGLPLILVDVPLRSTLHERFASRLIKAAPAVFAFAESSDADLAATYSGLLGVAGDKIEEIATSALGAVRAFTFRAGRTDNAFDDESVEIFAAPGEALEATESARRIHQIAAAGTRLDRIAILLRAPERQQPLVEEALRRAEIPAYFSRGVARPDPGGRALLALLACAAERCSAARFAEYLSFGELPRLDAAGAPKEAPPAFPAGSDDELLAAFGTAAAVEIETEPAEGVTALATPIAWERMLVDAAVIGGRDRWARRLNGLANEYRLKYQATAREGDSRAEAMGEQLRRIEALQAFALPLIDLLDTFRTAATWGGWMQRLDLLARLALRRPDHVRSVIAELEPMAAVGPVAIGEVLAVLSDRLRFVRREPARRRYGSVFIGSIAEAAGRVFDVVFIPGLAEGLFPQKSFEDPLLLDTVRIKLNPRLRTRDRARMEERLLLRRAIASARSRLIASYPTMDVGHSRPRVPSFYALEIARATQGRVPALRTFEEQARRKCAVMLAWPAPGRAADAVDKAEYDLAWFRQHRGADGSCVYLKSASPLYRSLRARYARWSKNWQSADGVVSPKEPALRVLQERLPSRHPYSASALQEYSNCPYRFYLRAIAGLREREAKPAIERMDPLTRGSLFHEAQHEFLSEARELEAAPVETVLDRADAALAAVEAKYREELAPAIPRLWSSEIEDMRNDLRGWARLWRAERDEWQSVYTEFAFGLALDAGRDPASSVDPATLPGGVQVRGAIDAVDRRRASGALRVTDHKTGRPPEQRPVCVGGGAVLQPVLYGMALESLLNSPVESGRLLFCTQRGGYTECSMALDDRARAFLNRAIEIIEAEIEKGFLPPAPREGACDWCEYRRVCGPHELARAARKSRHPLDKLDEVRCML